MEAEKKRKRGESGEVDGGGGRRKTEREVLKREKSEAAAPPPTEEEVEEFFAILRRMHVAVKYFERSNGNGDGCKLTERWGTALEAEVLGGGGEDVKVGEKRVEANGVLDLNAVPEAESNSV